MIGKLMQPLLLLLLLLQAPVQNLSGSVSAGLKGGLHQARALINKAAGAVSEAAAAKHKAAGGTTQGGSRTR